MASSREQYLLRQKRKNSTEIVDLYGHHFISGIEIVFPNHI
jgi:hypothetical protein